MFNEKFDILYVNAVEPLPNPGGRRFYEFHVRLSKEFKIKYLQGCPSGASKYCLNIKRELEESGISTEIIPVPIKIKTLKDLALFRFLAIQKIRRYIHKNSQKFRIIHEEASPVPIFSKTVAKRNKIVLLTLHEVRGLTSIKMLGPFGLAEYASEQALRLFKIYNVVITVSPSTHYIALNKLKLNNAILIPNGIDIKKFKRRDIVRNDDSIKIVTTGRLIKHKGYFLLPEVMKMLKKIAEKTGKKIEYIVIGRGPLDEFVERILQRYNGEANGKIRTKLIKRYLSDSEYIQILSEASIYLHLSPYMEGFGYAVAEAMACELPVIAFNILGIKDLIISGVNGFLVEPINLDELFQRLNILIKDDELRIRMSKKARKRIENHFNLDKSVRKLKKLYELLLK